MMRSRRTGIKLWRTSSLATLNSLHSPLEATNVMEEKAEKMFVRLKQEGQGWHLAEHGLRSKISRRWTWPRSAV